jgi:pectate lyase
VVFDVAGEILLRSVVAVRGSFVTVDGTTAKSPGITLRGAGLRIWGKHGAHDVVIRGIRIREPGLHDREGDGIDVKYGAHDVLIDHVSIDGCGDGNIDITRKARDVTVAWSVLSGCAKNMLIKYEASRVSLHHNVFVNSRSRNPNVAFTDEFLPNVAPEITADVRNNLVWHWGDFGGGTILQCGAKVNVVNNYYSSPETTPPRQERAIVDSGCPNLPAGAGATFHASGNYSADRLTVDLNRLGRAPAPFAANFVETADDACSAAFAVLTDAGVIPRDLVDRRSLEPIALGCDRAMPAPNAPPKIGEAL